MNEVLQFLADNAFMTMLFTNIVQAVGWFFAFKKRRIENDSGEASALDSIRELNNKIALDLKERYDEQSKRIEELEVREREAIKQMGVLNGQMTVLAQQNQSDKELIQKLNSKITAYKSEIAGWQAKFETLKKRFDQYLNGKHEK
ncbi:MAG: hypothetical protein IPH58_05655 [Sphingobacteriales bacterium]|jgi:peptidoglycan hydrolase CwlO-like protein|nr:hypothetical protein [Sphingobacteriales bacterium]